MPRKLQITKEMSQSSVSSTLSSVPDDIKPPVKLEINSKKRQAEAVVQDDDDASLSTDKNEGFKVNKQPKKKVKSDNVANGETLVKKRVSVKRQSKKDAAQAPLEERTVGSNLRVGAHVSTAGGTYTLYPLDLTMSIS